MQTPTPPTKPTPPTLPSMNSKPSANNSPELPSSSSQPMPNSTKAAKSTTTETPKEANTTTISPTTEKSVSPTTADNNPLPPQPPLGKYQETSSQITPAPIALTSKNKPSPLGFGFFFSLVLLVAILFACFRLWKSNQKKQRTILDYSADSSQDLLNLMNSSATFTPSSQKIVQGKSKSSSKIKSNFEVRI